VTVSLTNAAGEPISLFGTGNSMFASGTGTNAASFGQQQLFGGSNAAGGTGAAKITATSAGSTAKMGYTDLTKSPGRRPARNSPLQPMPPSTEPHQLTTSESPGYNAIGEGLKAINRHFSPEEQASRSGEFRTGQYEAKPGGAAAEGVAEDLAEAAELAL
jgi:hypothetical protein